MTTEKDFEETLPAGLIDSLKAADRPVPVITARADREIAALAKAQFADRRSRKRAPRAAWLAVAAAAVLAVSLVPFMDTAFSPVQDAAAPSGGTLYADVDNSGRIDIADVMLLARDTSVSRFSNDDIDAFARRVVSLSASEDAS